MFVPLLWRSWSSRDIVGASPVLRSRDSSFTLGADSWPVSMATFLVFVITAPPLPAGTPTVLGCAHCMTSLSACVSCCFSCALDRKTDCHQASLWFSCLRVHLQDTTAWAASDLSGLTVWTPCVHTFALFPLVRLIAPARFRCMISSFLMQRIPFGRVLSCSVALSCPWLCGCCCAQLRWRRGCVRGGQERRCQVSDFVAAHWPSCSCEPTCPSLTCCPHSFRGHCSDSIIVLRTDATRTTTRTNPKRYCPCLLT